MVRRIVPAVLLLLCAVCGWCEPAGKAYLFCLDNGQIIYEKNADKPLPMASLTKLMTAVTASDMKWDRVTMTPGALATEYANMNLKPGDYMSRDAALSAMLLESSNETAQAISLMSGDFIPEMNRRAKKLGMSNTAYLTPHGLDAAGHFSSCRDTVTLAGEVMKRKELRDIVCCSEKEIPVNGKEKRKLHATFAVFLKTVPGAAGIKTGTTTNAGSCFAGAVKLKKHYFYCVIFNSARGKAVNQAADEMKKILKAYTLTTVIPSGKLYRADSDFDRIRLVTKGTTELLLAKGDKCSTELGYSPRYPVHKGDAAAWLKVKAPGYEDTVILYAAETRLLPRWQMTCTLLLILLCIAGTIYYFLSSEKNDSFPTLH